jgi:4-amino-4-deoxy-L-arabinose transferase-like glycosyltransferase
LLLLLCAALIIRGRVMQANSAALLEDPDRYRSVAWGIFRHSTIGFYVGERGLDRPPTASRPPLYPLVLSIADFINDDFEPFGFGFLHVLLGVGTIGIGWLLAQRMGIPWQTALLAAALITIDPLLLHQSTQLMTETLATFLAAATLLALLHSAQDARLRWALAAGALLGLCILCRPTFLAWAALVVPAFVFVANGRRPVLRAALMTFCAALMLMPWAVRNQRLFGRPIITTTHGGATLLLANNPSFYEYLRSAPWGSVWDAATFYRDWKPHRDALPLRAVPGTSAYDEVAIDRLAYEAAWQNIGRQKEMFAFACLVRVGRLWNVLPHATGSDESTSRRGQRYAVAMWYVLEFALALIGAWNLGSRWLQAPWVFALLLVLSFTVVHMLYWTDMRMRAPLAVVIALAAAQGVSTLAFRKQSASPSLAAS